MNCSAVTSRGGTQLPRPDKYFDAGSYASSLWHRCPGCMAKALLGCSLALVTRWTWRTWRTWRSWFEFHQSIHVRGRVRLDLFHCMSFLRTMLIFSAHPNCTRHDLSAESLSLPFLPRPPLFFCSSSLLRHRTPFSLFTSITSHRFIPDSIVSPLHSCLPSHNPLICFLCCSAIAIVPRSLHVEAIFIHSFIAETTPFFYFGG